MQPRSLRGAASPSSSTATTAASSRQRCGPTGCRSTGTPTQSVSACARRSPAPRASFGTRTLSRTRRPTLSKASVKSSPAIAASSMPSAAEQVTWLESLSPWPEEFGLERMHALLRKLGDPQRAFPAIHVVGTNGKTTTTRLTEALLAGSGLAVGAYTSPHVTTWAERIRVEGDEVDVEAALAPVRRPAEQLCATQFEVLPAGALAAFAERRVDVAVVEAGLGGRLDATNVLRSPVQVLTNVALEHTQVLGETREEIAAEKLAVVQPGSTVVLAEPEWEG